MERSPLLVYSELRLSGGNCRGRTIRSIPLEETNLQIRSPVLIDEKKYLFLHHPSSFDFHTALYHLSHRSGHHFFGPIFPKIGISSRPAVIIT